MSKFGTREAGDYLGVSAATVRNWVRQGLLVPEEPNVFSEASVRALAERLAAGELGRLRGRANKSRSQASFIPTEYLEIPGLAKEIRRLVEFIKGHGLGHSLALWVVALRQLELAKEVRVGCSAEIGAPLLEGWRRSRVRREMESWLKACGGGIDWAAALALYRTTKRLAAEDSLGLLYQSLQSEGVKSDKGSYYTPGRLVDDALLELGACKGAFLDPCCGTGRILLRAARLAGVSADRLHGIELDELAWRIARLNLLLCFADRDFEPRILWGDSLLGTKANSEEPMEKELHGTFSVILTNPPWGAYASGGKAERIRRRFPEIQSRESFSLFAARCLEFANKRGRVSLFLPEAVLNIGAHRDIRGLLLARASLCSITQLGRCFEGVYSPVVRLVLRNGSRKTDTVEYRSADGKIGHLDQARFRANRDYVFETGLQEAEAALLDHLYSIPHDTLKGQADWALGIVTGDNRRFVGTKREPGHEPIVRGADLRPYVHVEPSHYIRHDPEKFQQMAPEWKYRAPEKLLYRFISNRLVFSLDRSGLLTLNSANVLIPRVPGLSCKVVMACLNSSMAQFIHSRRFNTHKVLRGNLEEVPLPRMTRAEHDEMEALVEECLVGAPRQEAVDALLDRLFNLSPAQCTLLRSRGRHTQAAGEKT